MCIFAIFWLKLNREKRIFSAVISEGPIVLPEVFLLCYSISKLVGFGNE
jgi:hypothetical protein